MQSRRRSGSISAGILRGLLGLGSDSLIDKMLLVLLLLLLDANIFVALTNVVGQKVLARVAANDKEFIM